MITDAVGYVALALMAAIAVLAFILACACVGLWVRFGREDNTSELWREAIFGSEEKGR